MLAHPFVRKVSFATNTFTAPSGRTMHHKQNREVSRRYGVIDILFNCVIVSPVSFISKVQPHLEEALMRFNGSDVPAPGWKTATSGNRLTTKLNIFEFAKAIMENK